MRGNAWACVGLRGKLFHVGLLTQNTCEGFVSRCVPALRIGALPALKFRSALIARSCPNILASNSLACFPENLGNICFNGCPPGRRIVQVRCPQDCVSRLWFGAGTLSLSRVVVLFEFLLIVLYLNMVLPLKVIDDRCHP